MGSYITAFPGYKILLYVLTHTKPTKIRKRVPHYVQIPGASYTCVTSFFVFVLYTTRGYEYTLGKVHMLRQH